MTIQNQLVPMAKLPERYSVHYQTVRNWLKDPRIGFPAPMHVNRRLYFYESDLRAWEISRVKPRSLNPAATEAQSA